MIVTYKPEGQPEQVWAFDPDRVLNSVAEVIEGRAGQRYGEWRLEVLAGKAKARRVLLWHLLTRDHPLMRFEDTPDFAMGDLEVERDYDELCEHRADIDKNKGLDSEVREMVLAQLDSEIEERIAAGDLGKAGRTSKSSDSNTAGTLPTSST